MSYTTLYKVPEQGEITSHATFHNAFRGAALVWDTLSRRYLGTQKFTSLSRDMQPIWNLWKANNIPLSYRIVLMSTFDNVMVKRENIPLVIEAIKEYAKEFDDAGHLPEQAKKLEELFDDQECFAICWNQTSVNADAWQTAIECKCCGETKDYRNYDVSQDKGHWFLFQRSREDKC